MNIYAAINGINAIASLSAASIILFNKSRKPIHLGHGWFSLLLFLYTFSYFLWGIQTDKECALFFLNLLIYFVCFIHMGYFHYVLILSDSTKKYRSFLIIGYVGSLLLAWINYKGLYCDTQNIRKLGPFLYWPHGTMFLLVLIVVQSFYVALAWVVLWRSHINSQTIKINLNAYLLISAIGWFGGLTNWLLFWDVIYVPPIGNFGILILVAGTYYLIFKHDFLQLGQMVKKAFIYALLALFVALIYTAFVLIGERISRGYFGYSSFISTLLAGLVIALLFNPIRVFLDRFINMIIFGKGIIELSAENLKMHLELEKQDRMMAVATLAAGMAHEIKNPITAIRTFAEFLPRKWDDPDFRARFSKLLIDETGRISNILSDLLSFARPSEPNIVSCDVKEVLKDITELLSGEFMRHSIRIEICGSENAQVVCSVDPAQIKQAFFNIIMNAIDAMKSKEGERFLLINARDVESCVKISFADTGVGIAKEKIQRIFEPFYTEKENGTGLGLAIAKSIILKNKGTVLVDSNIRVGTIFTIFLPRPSLSV